MKRGAEDAGAVAKAEGGSVTWLGPQNYDNLGVDAAELIRQAIQQGATAIVGPDWVPEAMDPAFKAVVDVLLVKTARRRRTPMIRLDQLRSMLLK